MCRCTWKTIRPGHRPMHTWHRVVVVQRARRIASWAWPACHCGSDGIREGKVCDGHKQGYSWGKDGIYRQLRSSQTRPRYRRMEAAAMVEVARLVCMPNFVWGVPIVSPKLKFHQCTYSVDSIARQPTRLPVNQGVSESDLWDSIREGTAIAKLVDISTRCRFAWW